MFFIVGPDGKTERESMPTETNISRFHAIKQSIAMEGINKFLANLLAIML